MKRGRGANALLQAVFGIYERSDGLIYVEPVEDVTTGTLQDIIDDKVSIEATLYSDTGSSYNGLEETFDDHQRESIMVRTNTNEDPPASTGSKASGPMPRNG